MKRIPIPFTESHEAEVVPRTERVLSRRTRRLPEDPEEETMDSQIENKVRIL